MTPVNSGKKTKKLKPSNKKWPRHLIIARDLYVCELLKIPQLDTLERLRLVKIKFGYPLGRATFFRIQKRYKNNNIIWPQ